MGATSVASPPTKDRSPSARLVDVLRQTLAALEEAHALGIVHRDLKPDNIVLEPLRSGLDFVKVVDFGLAKILVGGPPANSAGALTRPGLVCGTPEYMSPEQSRGDALDGRSDLYSVGVILFELLVGRVPFVADTATKTLSMHLTELPQDPRDVAPERGIPAPFAEVALRALAKSSDDRFQDAREFANALGQALLASEGGQPAEPARGTGIRCRACGTQCPLGQKFCGDCGASIVEQAPVERPAASRERAAAAERPPRRDRILGRDREVRRCSRSSRATRRSSGSRRVTTKPAPCSPWRASSATRAWARHASCASSASAAPREETSSSPFRPTRPGRGSRTRPCGPRSARWRRCLRGRPTRPRGTAHIPTLEWA